MLLALGGAGVVGCLTAETQPHPQLHHSCEFGMGVSAACRGSGVGTRLVGALLAWARQRGLRRIELTVFAHNAAAIRLYRRLGFAEEGRKVGAVALDSRYEDAILMAIQVDPVSTAPASG
jgi:RimJ/RimL family protein N-acetyltransferase